MVVLEVLKAICEAKMKRLGEIVHGTPERIDKDFPINIRLKCVLQFERTPFILAGEGKLRFNFPGEAHTVEAVGRFTFGEEIEFFNFYLRCGAEEAILQIAQDIETKKVIEATYYREAFKVFPSPDNGEWGDWLDWIDLDNLSNPQQGVLGCYTLTLAEGEEPYEILFPECPGDRTAPFFCTEKITDDPLMEEIIRVNHYFAIYGKNVDNDFVEKLFVSKDEDSETACIRILAGIPIDIGEGTFANSGFIQVL